MFWLSFARGRHRYARTLLHTADSNQCILSNAELEGGVNHKGLCNVGDSMSAIFLFPVCVLHCLQQKWRIQRVAPGVTSLKGSENAYS